MIAAGATSRSLRRIVRLRRAPCRTTQQKTDDDLLTADPEFSALGDLLRRIAV